MNQSSASRLSPEKKSVFLPVLKSHSSTNQPLASNHGNKGDNIVAADTGIRVSQRSRFPLTTDPKLEEVVALLSPNADTISSDVEINIGRLKSILLTAHRKEVLAGETTLTHSAKTMVPFNE